VDRVDLDSGYDVEARLLEAQAHAPRASEKIDSDWSHQLLLCLRIWRTLAEHLVNVDRSCGPEEFPQSSFKMLNFFEFTLPNLFDVPANRLQFGPFLRIPLTIALDLGKPEIEVRFRGLSNLAAVAMPVTPMNEDRFLATEENDVGLTGQVFAMQPEAVTEPVEELPDSSLWLSMLRTDA
tara:strand:+ start:2307 stop:2846 length:540 start_codon:yes stop_codon:yes gene_type:complete